MDESGLLANLDEEMVQNLLSASEDDMRAMLQQMVGEDEIEDLLNRVRRLRQLKEQA